MTFKEYSDALKSKNPKLFSAGKIQISPESFEAQLLLAYNAGHSEGFKFAKELRQFDNRNTFEKIFGI